MAFDVLPRKVIGGLYRLKQVTPMRWIQPPFATRQPRCLNDKGEPQYLAANAWLDRYPAVEQMTWAPQSLLDHNHSGSLQPR